MSRTKRRVRHLKSASTRATLERRAAGARAAKAVSAQATPPTALGDASAHTGARFIVIERTERDLREQEIEPGCLFAVVEAETAQVPENWFGRSWIGYHADREAAQAEAAQLNALAGRFPATTRPVITPACPTPMGVPGPVFGEKPTAWELQLLAPTQEMPAVTEQDPEPLQLPGVTRLRAVVEDISHRPPLERIAAAWRAAGATLDDPSARAFEQALHEDGESADEPAAPAVPDARPGRETFDVSPGATQLPRIIDAVNADLPTHGRHSVPLIPGLRRAPVHEIRASQQVLCTDGAWRSTQGGSLRDGVAVLVMDDLTEHAFNAAMLFWVRTTPTAATSAGLRRPPCPNGCFRTQADFQLCSCNWGCGCAPHPAPRATMAPLADTRELHLAGAVA